jgi:hypothetical protein
MRMAMRIGGLAVHLRHSLSGQVGMDNFNQFFGRQDAWIVSRRRRIKDMLKDVIFDYFSDKSVQSASACGRLLQNSGAASVLFDPAFDGVHLAPDASQSKEQLPLLFFLAGMCHRVFLSYRGVLTS